VDVPVQQIIIVQNSIQLSAEYVKENDAMSDVDVACRNVTEQFVDASEFIIIHQPGRNLGYGGSMNHGILATSAWADWWLLLNAGIYVCP
jgi:GT2 family glycosyltransferase